MISVDDLKAITPYCAKYAQTYVDPLNAAMREFEIDVNYLREAAFLAQILHESGSLRYTKELASGAAYEGRKDLGDTEPGDGVHYKGRGLIQITGKDNYVKCGDALGLDLVTNPDLLEQPDNACRSAGWFWSVHGLNDLADRSDLVAITKRINGGTNGLAERQTFYNKALGVLG